MLAQAAASTNDTITWIVVAIAIIVIVALIAVAARRQRSQHLKQRFGREYDRTVSATGSPARAEAELERREKRVRSLDLKPLSPGARARYAEEWRGVQANFVDQPHVAVAQADRLISDAMRDRGYPTDTAQRFDDLSVEHADVLSNYRTATKVAQDDVGEQVGTEDLRRAMVAYRALFAELVGEDPINRNEGRTASTGQGVNA